MSRRHAATVLSAALGAAVLAWATHAAGGFAFLAEQPGEVLRLLGEHVVLVAASGGTAVAAGVALGVGISRPRWRRWAAPAIWLTGLGQTVPALALLALLFAVVGRVGFLPAYLALALATLLPVVRNTCQGLLGVEPAVLEAGRGMGMAPRQVLWRLELPNALAVIAAGVRTALVFNVGSAALAYLIGGGGLGDLIFTGIDTRRTDILLAGALPTTALALGLDWLLGRLERRLVPRGLRARD